MLTLQKRKVAFFRMCTAGIRNALLQAHNNHTHDNMLSKIQRRYGRWSVSRKIIAQKPLDITATAAVT